MSEDTAKLAADCGNESDWQKAEWRGEALQLREQLAAEQVAHGETRALLETHEPHGHNVTNQQYLSALTRAEQAEAGLARATELLGEQVSCGIKTERDECRYCEQPNYVQNDCEQILDFLAAPLAGQEPRREEARERDEEFVAMQNTLNRHPRAAKLMGKSKPFVVVACDEPYYAQVYGLIREHEQAIGRWTAEDEDFYRQALDALKEGNNASM